MESGLGSGREDKIRCEHVKEPLTALDPEPKQHQELVKLRMKG